MSDFRTRKSVEELAREQGVVSGALDDWLAGPWSEEEDEEIDEFLALRREMRQEPRPNVDERDAASLAATK